MTSLSAHVAVLNSLLFVRDPNTNELPEIDGRGGVWSTPSCVAISCLPDSEGSTKIIMGSLDEVSDASQPLFDGRLRTPSRIIIVETVLRETVLQAHVPAADTRLRVWTNGHPATDRVTIAWE